MSKHAFLLSTDISRFQINCDNDDKMLSLEKFLNRTRKIRDYFLLFNLKILFSLEAYKNIIFTEAFYK